MEPAPTTRSLYERTSIHFLHDVSYDPKAMHQTRGRSKQISQVAAARDVHHSERRERKLFDDLKPGHRQPALKIPSIPNSPDTQHQPPLAIRGMTACDAWLYSDVTATGSFAMPALSPPSGSRSISPTPIPTPNDSYNSETDYFLSIIASDPLSQPKTLEDQLYFAYADDNIRLAKIIFLKLKGINVVSDDDPRIDEVKEDDFDECFVPSGGLDLGGCQVNLADRSRSERERRARRQRDQRLAECRQRWTEAKEAAKRERLLAMHMREVQTESQKPRGRKMKPDPTKSSYDQRARGRAVTRNLLSYSLIYSSADVPSSSHQTSFQYECMPITKPATSPRRSSKNKELEGSRFMAVTFDQVLASMHGPLFPFDPTEHVRMRERSGPRNDMDHSLNHWSVHPRCLSQERSRSLTRSNLLADLLETEWEGSERDRIMAKEDVYKRSRTRLSSVTCMACSATSSTSSSLSRSASWLSIGGSQCSSASTCATTPSSSPIYSWLKSSTLGSIRTTCESVPRASSPPVRHSCRAPQQLTPVAPADSPLHMVCPLTHSGSDAMDFSQISSHYFASGKSTGAAKDRVRCHTLVSFASDLVSRAKDFQKTYIAGAVSVVGSHSDGASSACSHKLTLNAPGYRARREDVSAFLTPQADDADYNALHAQAIPLRCPSSPSTTHVPNRARAFPPPPLLPRSPYRSTEPPGSISLRLRPIENPVNLRLRALQNVMCERGKQWEGRAPDGALGCGRERLVGICWEGLGRSGLGLERRLVSSF